MELVFEGDNFFLKQHEGSRCRYAAVGELRAIGEVIPTASKIAKSGVTVVRAQTEAFIGSVREHGAIALSQYLGRIFVGPKLYESVDLKAGMWVDLGVHSADASQANAFCFWEAKTIAVIENSAKLESNIRRCHVSVAWLIETVCQYIGGQEKAK
ncbi:unnamed protein product [Toxocara canis]|uniref:Uncharacterized protein n=1 Tax=Toxocara canis TaxID=6265 RepID=A0A3P7FF53_TOXCA|nr:unnamed protein product [Toxocara canis]